jgi:hypothetical protein
MKPGGPQASAYCWDRSCFTIPCWGQLILCRQEVVRLPRAMANLFSWVEQKKKAQRYYSCLLPRSLNMELLSYMWPISTSSMEAPAFQKKHIVTFHKGWIYVKWMLN